MMNKRTLLLSATGIGALLLLSLLAFLITYQSDRKSTGWLSQERLGDVLLEREDLPLKWSSWIQQTYELEVANGEGVTRGFLRSSHQSWVNVAQRVYVYDSLIDASTAYQSLLEEYSRFELQGWGEVPFESVETSSVADHIACGENFLNGWHVFICRFVGLYDNVVVRLAANIFDDRWVTAEDLRAVIAAVDRKAVSALDEGSGIR